MEDCCGSDNKNTTNEQVLHCPRCGKEGKQAKLITLKSLLTPEALSRLDPATTYRSCVSKECQVVYYGNSGLVYLDTDLKVLVYPKSDSPACPVCYCFDWTRERLQKDWEETGGKTAYESIERHIKAGRCGCDVNNPHGSCCLGDIKKYELSLPEIKDAP